MKTASVAGIVLIILGVIALAYQEFTYTTPRKVADVGPVHALKEEQNTIPIPPIVGGAAVLGGVALLWEKIRAIETKTGYILNARACKTRDFPQSLPAREVFHGIPGKINLGHGAVLADRAKTKPRSLQA